MSAFRNRHHDTDDAAHAHTCTSTSTKRSLPVYAFSPSLSSWLWRTLSSSSWTALLQRHTTRLPPRRQVPFLFPNSMPSPCVPVLLLACVRTCVWGRITGHKPSHHVFQLSLHNVALSSVTEVSFLLSVLTFSYHRASSFVVPSLATCVCVCVCANHIMLPFPSHLVHIYTRHLRRISTRYPCAAGDACVHALLGTHFPLASPLPSIPHAPLAVLPRLASCTTVLSFFSSAPRLVPSLASYVLSIGGALAAWFHLLPCLRKTHSPPSFTPSDGSLCFPLLGFSRFHFSVSTLLCSAFCQCSSLSLCVESFVLDAPRLVSQNPLSLSHVDLLFHLLLLPCFFCLAPLRGSIAPPLSLLFTPLSLLLFVSSRSLTLFLLLLPLACCEPHVLSTTTFFARRNVLVPSLPCSSHRSFLSHCFFVVDFSSVSAGAAQNKCIVTTTFPLFILFDPALLLSLTPPTPPSSSLPQCSPAATSCLGDEGETVCVCVLLRSRRF